MSLLVADNGCIHGAVVSELASDELTKLLTSPFPDERILDCNFIAIYTFFTPMICESIDDSFTFLKKLGFSTPVTINTTIPKWDRAVESAKLAAGSGYAGYKCDKILTAYSNTKMIDLLSANVQNRWGVLTPILMSTLFEVSRISWDTIVEDNSVNVVPVVVFRFGHNTIVNSIIFDQDTVLDKENRLLYKKIRGFKTIDIGKYCIGDMFVASLGDNRQLVLERRFGSGKIPILTPGCPQCKQAVDVRDNKLFCVNVRCPSVVLSSVHVWADKFCDVKDDVLIDFLRRYEVASLSDIYSIADSGDMSIAQYLPIFNGVEKSREHPAEFLNIILPFLTIDECKQVMAVLHFGSTEIDFIISNLFTDTKLTNAGLSDTSIDKVLKFIDGNRLQFVNIIKHYLGSPEKHELYKRTFVVVGLLRDTDKTRYEKIINNRGGRVVSNITPYISGCIYGKFVESTSLDAVKELAKHKDIAIYSEEEFTKQFVGTQKEEVRHG